MVNMKSPLDVLFQAQTITAHACHLSVVRLRRGLTKCSRVAWAVCDPQLTWAPS